MILRSHYLLLLLAVCLAGGSARAQERSREAGTLSLDSLLNVKISTASRMPQTVSEAPASVTIVTADDIERYGYRTLDEVLSTVKGFYRSYDRNYSYIGTRGFSRPTDYNDRLLLLLDGHEMNDNFYGSASVGTDFPLDFASIERIEIVRGPGSALYGTGAMFAVINVITKRGNRIDGVNVSAEAGSYGHVRGSLLAGKRWESGLEASLSGSWADVRGHDLYYSQYDSPSTNHGIAHNLDWDRYYSTFGSVSYGGFSFAAFLSSRKKGIPTGSFETLFNDSRAHTVDEYGMAELKYDADIGSDKSISIKTSYFRYNYAGEYPYEIDSFDANDARVFEGDVQFKWDLFTSNRLVVGTELRHNTVASYRYWDINTTYFDANFPYDVYSFYFQDEYQLSENLLITLGLRHDRNSFGASSTTPRIAFVYNPLSSSAFKLLYGEGFRAPNLYEEHYADPLSGFKTNPSLQPEKIRTLEAVWEQRFGTETFGSISLYKYTMDNLIDTGVDPRDSMAQFQNISKVNALGLELDLETRLRSGLTGYANYSLQEVKDDRTQLQLSNAPRHLVHIGAGYQLFSLLEVSAEMQYETGRKTVYGTVTDPFLVTNLNIVAFHLSEGFTGSLSVRNLFNVSYSNPGGFEHRQPDITQDGRTFLVKLDYKF